MGEMIFQIQNCDSIPDLVKMANKDFSLVYGYLSTELDRIAPSASSDKTFFFISLLDRVLVLLTIYPPFIDANQSYENYQSCMSLMALHFRNADFLPPQWYPYFTERLLSLAESHIQQFYSNESKSRSTSSPMNGVVFRWFPAFFNVACQQHNAIISVDLPDILTTEQLRGQFLCRLYQSSFWNIFWAKELMVCIRSLSLTSVEFANICTTINSFLRLQIPFESLPTLITEYLTMCRHPLVKKRIVLTGIVNCFFNLDDGPINVKNQDFDSKKFDSDFAVEDLYRMEGLVFMAFDQNFASNPKLTLEFISMTKESSFKTLNPFSLGLMLVLIHGSNALHKKALNLLTDWIFLSIKTNRLKISIPTPLDEMRSLIDTDFCSSMKIKLNDIMSRTSRGWEICVPGIKKLAFRILELCSTLSECENKILVDMASDILVQLFNWFPHARISILEGVFWPMFNSTEMAIVYVNVFQKLVSSNLLKFNDYLPKIMDQIYDLDCLPLHVAQKLIYSLNPLIQYPDFQDRIILVLRKGTFSPDLNTRIISVVGLLIILKGLVRGICTNSGFLAPRQVEELAMEILRFLKKSLTQQSIIKTILYRDLCLVFKELLEWEFYCQKIDNKNFILAISSVEEAVLEVFYDQVSLYFSVEDETFNVKNCVRTTEGVVEVVEPLHMLMQACNFCIFNFYALNPGTLHSFFIDALSEKMEKLISFLLKFELNSFSNHNLETEQGRVNHELGIILIGMFEISMEYLITTKNVILNSNYRSSLEMKRDTIFVKSEEPNLPNTEWEKSRNIFHTVAKLPSENLDQVGIFDRICFLKTIIDENLKSVKSFKISVNHPESQNSNSKSQNKSKCNHEVSDNTISTLIYTSILSRQCILDILNLASDSIEVKPDGPGSEDKLFKNRLLVQFVISNALHDIEHILDCKRNKSQSFAVASISEGLNCNLNDQDYIENLSGFLLRECFFGRKSGSNSSIGWKMKPLATIALECYIICLKFIFEQENVNLVGKVAGFIRRSIERMGCVDELQNATENTGDGVQIYRFVAYLLQGPIDKWAEGQLELWLELASLLVGFFEEAQLVELSNFLGSLMGNVGLVGNLACVRSASILFWKVLARSKSKNVFFVFRQIADDIFVCGGSNSVYEINEEQIRDDEDLVKSRDGKVMYATVTAKSVSVFANVILRMVEERWMVYEFLHGEVLRAEKTLRAFPEAIDKDDDIPSIVEKSVAEMEICKYWRELIYSDATESIFLLMRLSSCRLNGLAAVLLVKVIERIFRIIHSWFLDLIKKGSTKPILRAFEVMVDSLGCLFDRLNNFILYWIKNTNEKQNKSSNSANKHIPILVYWMERLHADDLIKLVSIHNIPNLLNKFQNFGNLDWSIKNHTVLTTKPKK